MKRIFFLILFFSNSILYSQFDDYEVLYASQYGYPFELRQVFLNEPDICDQTEHTQFKFYFKNVREQDKLMLQSLILIQEEILMNLEDLCVDILKKENL